MELGEGLKKILLVGIGTAAVTAEKSKEILDELVKKGELTVEQGKVLNQELKHNIKSTVKTAADSVKESAARKNDQEELKATISKLTPEQLAAVNAALAKADKWSAWHNCAAFGAAVWNTVCTDKVDPGTPPTPASLAASVRSCTGKWNADPAVPFDYVVYYGYPAVPSKEFA